MENLDSIFEEDLGLGEFDKNEEVQQPVSSDNDGLFEGFETPNDKGNTVLDEYLKSKGISDSKITIVDDNNEEKEVNFYELSKDEQLEILNSVSEPLDDNDLDDGEINLINHLRSNDLSIEDFLEGYKQSIISELGQEPNQTYDIDAYDDQELFILDLKNKYDLTDEELVKELQKELEDETLFKKKVDILRTEYKNLEEQYNLTQQAEAESQREEQYNQFSETMVNIAIETPEFYGIELEDDEKNEVLSFLLDLDERGTSNFYKTLNDPKKLYEAAWFLRYGKESFDALKNAYESEITRLKKTDNSKQKTKPIINRKSDDEQTNSIFDLNF